MNLRELGEARLLEKITAGLTHDRRVLVGVGDDCAVTETPGSDKLLLLKTDCTVAGVHFHAKAKPVAVGWKAMARPLSDFAAMSGLPEFALITLVAPATTDERWIEGVYRGLTKAARAFGVAIVGGETSRIDGPLVISVSVVGSVERDRWVSRSGGKVGDDIFVTGRLGGSIRGRHLRFIPRLEESRWLTKHFPVHAMMDLSDGLGADLPRLAQASKLSFEIEQAAIPRARGSTIKQAISDGEDYELLFTLPTARANSLTSRWKKRFPKLPLTRIGRLIPRSAIRNPHFPAGYVHFR